MKNGRVAQITQFAALLLGFALIATASVVVVDTKDDAKAPPVSFEPLIPGGPDTLADLCEGLCTADLVALPELRVVESVVDLPMPETTGALSVERVWTGERSGMFGRGWESMWDIRLVDGTLVGPLPAEPFNHPQSAAEVELTDGTTIRLDSDGRPDRICPDAALCTTAEWSDTAVLLSAGDATVELEVQAGKAVSATSGDGRTVRYGYEGDRLTRATGDAVEVDYSYTNGLLSRIAGTDARSFRYADTTLESMTDRDGNEWSFSRAGSNQIQVTRPDDEVVTYDFDGRNLVEATGSKTGLWVTRSYEDGALVAESRPRDGVTMNRTSKNVVEVIQERDLEPDRRSQLTFDSSGRVVESVSSEGVVAIAYEGNSSRPVTTRSGDAVTKMKYDDAGLLVATTDPDGYEVSIQRDDLGRVRSLSDGILETNFTYDATGTPISEESAGRTTTAEVEADGQLRSLGLSDGTELPFEYDSSNNLVSIGSDDVAATLSQLDEMLAEPSGDTDLIEDTLEWSNGPEYRYRSGRVAQYDEWGRLTRLSIDDRAVTRSYDDQGNLTEQSFPDGRTYSMTYTAAGRIESVSDGTVTAALTWHGDLLTAASTSTGTEYRYDYDTSGMLIASQVGDVRWGYQYDDAGNVSEVTTPSGPISYAWDQAGRPIRALIDGQIVDYSWLGSEFDLEAVTGSDGDLVRFERNRDGQVTGMDTEDGHATFAYTDGALTRYELANGFEATLSYNVNGDVATIDHDSTTETWHWSDKELRAVSVDDARYELDWLSPGILRSVSRDGKKVMQTETDRFDRPQTILDADDEVASFNWSGAGLTDATFDDWVLKLRYDDERRPTLLDVDGATVTPTYDKGVPTGLAVDDTTITSTYADGHVTSSRFEEGDNWANIEWNAAGQPDSFTSSEGAGSFGYRSGRVSTIRHDDETRNVTYDEDDGPSADGTGGDLLADLFGSDGRFTVTTGEHISAPWAPWFDALPAELGLDLPSALTADDVISAAVATATPDIVSPLAPDGAIAEQTAQTVLALATPNSIPVAADRLGTFIAQPGEVDLDPLVSASPSALVGTSALTNLADSPGLVRRALDVGSGIIGKVGKAGATILQFLTDTTIGQVVLSFLFIAALFLAGGGVPGAVAGAIRITGNLAGVLLSTDGDPVGAAYTYLLDPLAHLWTGLRELDPAAVAISTAVVAAFVLTALLLRRSGGVIAAGGRIQKATFGRLCKLNPGVCLAVVERSVAAWRVVQAQAGNTQVLKLVKAGNKARHLSVSESTPTIEGFDHRRYPATTAHDSEGPSVTYVDPSGDRRLGALLNDQLDGLPDGSHFYVLPLA